MCHADMTLYTYEWRPEIEIPCVYSCLLFIFLLFSEELLISFSPKFLYKADFPIINRKMITHRPHVCANWEHLSNWVGDRSVHLKGGIIRHAFTGLYMLDFDLR